MKNFVKPLAPDNFDEVLFDLDGVIFALAPIENNYLIRDFKKVYNFIIINNGLK